MTRVIASFLFGVGMFALMALAYIVGYSQIIRQVLP